MCSASAETTLPQAAKMASDRPRLGPRLAAQRSRVSNGSDVLPDVDGRSAIARRYRDIIAAIMTDQGGADRMSEARQQLVRRFAAASVLAEQLELRIANGETDQHQRARGLIEHIDPAGAAHRPRSSAEAGSQSRVNT